MSFWFHNPKKKLSNYNFTNNNFNQSKDLNLLSNFNFNINIITGNLTFEISNVCKFEMIPHTKKIIYHIKRKLSYLIMHFLIDSK